MPRSGASGGDAIPRRYPQRALAPVRAKIKIGEAVMNEPALWNPEENQVTAQELLERGCKAGREEGRKVSGVAG